MINLSSSDFRLSKQEEALLVEAIARAESNTTGEIRVHIAEEVNGDILLFAEQTFAFLKMHETPDRNGVLILLSPKKHQFALWGDQNIHHKLGKEFWEGIKIHIQECFKKGDFLGGLISAVNEVGRELAIYFPKTNHDKNDLSDDITYS